MFTFGRRAEAELAHRRAHARRILRLDGDRPRATPCAVRDLRQLRHGSRRSCSARAACAPRRRPASSTRLDHLGDELVERVLGARERRDGGRRAPRAPRRRPRARAGTCAFMTGLHCSSPSSFVALEPLDVHQPVANLDRGVARTREEVDLVALLHRARERARRSGSRPRRSSSPNVRHSQRGTIGGVGVTRRRSAKVFAKYSSALRVFVSCSPETSTPWAPRNARSSAATWKASVVAQRVESSSTREPSG